MSNDLINGPWKVGGGVSLWVMDSDRTTVATVTGRNQAQVNHRAALIAAAPALLESVKKYLSQNGANASVIESREAMRRAVELAEGGK